MEQQAHIPKDMSAFEAFFTSGPLWWDHPGCGFELFGPKHLAVLALVACTIVLLAYAYARLTQDAEKSRPRRRALLAVSLTGTTTMACVYAIRIAQAGLAVSNLPLYSCNLCMVLSIADAIHPSRTLDNVLFAMGLTGGVGALLFCGWTQCPIWCLASLSGFVEHGCLVLFCVMRLVGRDFYPDVHRIWAPITVSAAYLAAIIPVNLAHGTSFMFVPDPMETAPLEALYQALGNPGYTVFFCLALLVLYLLEYAIAGQVRRRA